MKTKRSFLALALAFACATPAFAGITYTAVTSADGKGAEMQASTVKAAVDSGKARVEFVSSGNPIMGKGTYLLTNDGGKTMYLVNPEEKSYSKWDLDAMMGAAGGVMKAMGGFMKMTFSDPKVEKLLEEPGPTMLGVPTTHYRFRTSYSMQMSVMGHKSASSNVTEEDIWTTTELGDPALGAWMRKGPPKTGDEQLDKLFSAEMSKVTGFPMKRVAKVTQTDANGKAQTSTTTMEVTALDRDAAVPPATFAMPSGYEERPLFPTMGGE